MQESWISNLYTETFQKWEEAGKPSGGYSIFYSPVSVNPQILIIGYNPGGGSNDFSGPMLAPPEKHDYERLSYPLARNMTKIFESLTDQYALTNTVKFNLIYFRSRKATDVQDTSLIDWFLKKDKLIIEKLQPKVIITEGFKTFELINKGISRITESNPVINKGKRIMRFGFLANGIPILGLKHPSGSWGRSDNDIHLTNIMLHGWLSPSAKEIYKSAAFAEAFGPQIY